MAGIKFYPIQQSCKEKLITDVFKWINTKTDKIVNRVEEERGFMLYFTYSFYSGLQSIFFILHNKL